MISPFQAISEGVDSSLVANTLILCATVVVTAMVATHLFGSRSALPAAVFTATQPMVVGLSRTTLVDTLLVLLVALAVWAAILSDGFRERRWAVACGIVVGLATLTKVTAPGILALPLLGTLALAAKMEWRRQLTNAAVGAGVAAFVCLPWFAVNFSPTLDYIESTTSGSLAIGTTSDPLSYAALRTFAVSTFHGGVGLTLLGTFLVAGLPRLDDCAGVASNVATWRGWRFRRCGSPRRSPCSPSRTIKTSGTWLPASPDSRCSLRERSRRSGLV